MIIIIIIIIIIIVVVVVVVISIIVVIVIIIIINLINELTIDCLFWLIISGGNSGIGKAAALELAKRGARVIIGCRNKVKAEAAVTLIRRRTGSDAVHYLPLDLASLESVKQFVDMFIKQYGPAYALVNNAGIQ